VLANEEVTADGRSERGNFPVFRRSLKQWMMRITSYADRLVADLDRLDWPESVKAMQRNWIGRSQGARVRFPVEGFEGADSGTAIEVFTTRPDTLFGATYMVLAPEHPLVDAIAPAAWPEGTGERWSAGATDPRTAVADYRAAAARKSELDRQENRREDRRLHRRARHQPGQRRAIPVFVADYVLMGYGTGAIMAVPGQDQRDWDFARVFGLPIVRTVQPPRASTARRSPGDGPAINSANDEISLDGLGRHRGQGRDHRLAGRARRRATGRSVQAARLAVLPAAVLGRAVPGRLGRPGLPVTADDAQLPVELPEIDDYSPKSYDPDDADTSPEPPLGRAAEWLDAGDGLVRETNTMPQWAGSCWYYLRYLDPQNHERFVDPEVERYWLGADPARPGDPGGVDLYVGGVEHAVLHLLYARFWHKVLHDLGTSAPRSRSGGWSTRATSRPSPTPTPAAPTCRPRRSSGTSSPVSRGTPSRSGGSTGRWASRCATW
jgi:leucyl-tRNA synthetase